MRFDEAKAHGAKDSANVGGVIFGPFLFGIVAMLDQPIEDEHAHYVRFGLFEAGIGGPNRLIDLSATVWRTRIRRAKFVRYFMHHRGGQIAVARSLRGLVRA